MKVDQFITSLTLLGRCLLDHLDKVVVITLAVILILFSFSVYGQVEDGDSDNTENHSIENDSEEDNTGNESEEEWVKYVPEKDELLFSINNTEEGVIVKVQISFVDLGYRVKEWGNVFRENGVFSVDTKMEKFTGPAGQTIKVVDHSYNLGDLEKGDYEFQFMFCNEEVASVQFSVPEG